MSCEQLQETLRGLQKRFKPGYPNEVFVRSAIQQLADTCREQRSIATHTRRMLESALPYVVDYLTQTPTPGRIAAIDRAHQLIERHTKHPCRKS